MSTIGHIGIDYFSQENLLRSGCLDMHMAMEVSEKAMRDFERGRVIFPNKIVQIFDEGVQTRINCLAATLLEEKICGAKWVSVFPQNRGKYGIQNLCAVIVLSEIERGRPLAFLEGTLCSNMRVGAIAGIAAKHFARPNSRTIGFIGAGEQAKMHLLAIKTVIPALEVCRVASKNSRTEQQFIDEMGPLLPDISFEATGAKAQKAIEGADIIVTATNAQFPLLKADWIGSGVFYSHIGGWEDEYDVVRKCEKIVCDDWGKVKHRTQTLSRMYKDGFLSDDDIYANLVDVVTGKKLGRENDDENIYFNAVGLSYLDVAISYAMYKRAKKAGEDQSLSLQDTTIFQHDNLADYISEGPPKATKVASNENMFTL
ncbi:MAG: ornithine cyclodeaminase family protein [Bacteriovoracales bacterium]|nr:ornithine cyclodeaminase family protein [Bacteriovoracales bacterium]